MPEKGRFSRFLSAILTLGLAGGGFTTGRRYRPPAEREPHQPDLLKPEPREPATRRSPLLAAYDFLWNSIGHFLDDDCTTMAASLAYYTTFSIASVILILVSIVGLIVGRQAVQQQIQSQIQDLIGQGPASQISAIVRNAAEHRRTGIVSTILGSVALLLGATGAFVQLQKALNRIWRVKPDPRIGDIKNFFLQRMLSFGMILAIAFLLFISLAVSTTLEAFGNFVSLYLPRGFSGPLLVAIGFLVSLGIITALFAAIFKVLPDAQIRWRNVWVGAVLAALLFTGGKFLIGKYLAHSGAASTYGAAGSFVLIILWIYYSSLIFLFGAELIAAWSEAHAEFVRPKRGAVRDDRPQTAGPRQAA